MEIFDCFEGFNEVCINILAFLKAIILKDALMHLIMS